jgi:fumarylpyruvate hydrolase
MSYVFAAAPARCLPVFQDDRLIPVRRVYCVGRNYAAHAREMGFSDRDPPFFFCKPGDSVLTSRHTAELTVAYPDQTRDYQHEVELVAVIGRGGQHIPVESALDHVWGYAIGLDMTRRDAQIEMRRQGRPWEIGKSFDDSAIVGAVTPVSHIGHISAGRIRVEVDGQIRQDSDVSLLIWSVAEIIAHLSAWFRLEPGDLIFTGTPEGVGPVLPGQAMHAVIEGLQPLRVRVEPPILFGATQPRYSAPVVARDAARAAAPGLMCHPSSAT